MTFEYKTLPETPADLGENDVRVCSSQYECIAGSPASKNRLYPWKSRVVSVSTSAGTIHRLLKGHGRLSIPAGVCWLGPRTRTQLDVQGSTEIKIELVRPQWLGRFRYYNTHLDDATRFTFRIGFWGLILGAASILLSAVGFLKLP